MENDNKTKIISDLIEIYSTSSLHEYRTLIEKHFIPSEREIKENAEIPNPVLLVNEMLTEVSDINLENSYGIKKVRY